MFLSGIFTLENNKYQIMSALKKQKVSCVSEAKGVEFSTTPKSDTFSECSVGTALDNLWECLDEVKEELALLTSEMYILKNLLEKVSSLPFPPPLVRQDHLGQSTSHDFMETDIAVNCCIGK